MIAAGVLGAVFVCLVLLYSRVRFTVKEANAEINTMMQKRELPKNPDIIAYLPRNTPVPSTPFDLEFEKRQHLIRMKRHRADQLNKSIDTMIATEQARKTFDKLMEQRNDKR